MLTIEQIKNNINNYSVSNGVVIQKNNNQQITDEQTILEVKSSILIYNEAKASYQSDINQFGKSNGDVSRYIDKTMEKLAVRDESNSYGANKLVNALISSNGSFDEMIGDNDLSDSKFSIFFGQKKDYGIAYLRLKCREHGFDLDSFNINLDTTEFQKNGVSKVSIYFNKKEYKKNNTSEQIEIHNLDGNSKKEYATEQLQKAINANDEDMIKYWQTTIEHTKSTTFNYSESSKLNKLEQMKKEAILDGDETLANYYSSNIKMTLQNNPIEVSPEQWDNMNQEQKRQFILLKMKESKALDDKDAFNYWNTNLKRNDSNNELNQMLDSNTTISEKKGIHR